MKYLDAHYTKTKEKNRQLYAEQFAKWVFKRFFKKTGKLLDLGCGKGYFLNAFKKLGFSVKGVDLESINKNIKKVDLEKGKLPFSNNSFDFVICIDLIEHINNPDNLMKETRRVLKPSGLFVIYTPNWNIFFKNFYDDYTHVKPYTPLGLSRMLTRYEFKIIHLSKRFRIPYLWRFTTLAFNFDLEPFIFVVSKK